MQGIDQGLVSIGRAAEILEISVGTLRRWTTAGRIESDLTPGGHRRYRLEELRRLREEARSHESPRLRPPHLPEQPLPSLADLIETRGPEISDAAARHVYAPGSTGWFGATASEKRVEFWLQGLSAACRANNYVAATATTTEFCRDALLAGYGVSVEECFRFLEVFGTMVARELGTHGESSDARRLMSALRFGPFDFTLSDIERPQHDEARPRTHRFDPRAAEANTATGELPWQRQDTAVA